MKIFTYDMCLKWLREQGLNLDYDNIKEDKINDMEWELILRYFTLKDYQNVNGDLEQIFTKKEEK